MAQAGGGPVATFTIGFEDDSGFDERPYARFVAQAVRHRPHQFVVDPDAVELVERLVWHHDQPFGDSSALPTFLLSELTRKHVNVALCGDGGDELFAGYERFAAAWPWALGRLPRPLRRAVRRAGPAAGGPHGAGWRAAPIRRRRSGDPADAYRGVADVRSRRPARAELPGADDWGGGPLRRIWEQSEGAHPLDRLLGAQPADLPPRRPAAQGGPHEDGARARGALAVPGRRLVEIACACRRS